MVLVEDKKMTVIASLRTGESIQEEFVFRGNDKLRAFRKTKKECLALERELKQYGYKVDIVNHEDLGQWSITIL